MSPLSGSTKKLAGDTLAVLKRTYAISTPSPLPHPKSALRTVSMAMLCALTLAPALMSPVAEAAVVRAAPADDAASLSQSSQPPRKHSVLITYGDDNCPAPTGDEIIVCAQQPESERYRVPKELRTEVREDPPAMGGSWSSAVESYDNIARVTRPDGCSAVGTYGATGCAAAALRQWHAERREIQ